MTLPIFLSLLKSFLKSFLLSILFSSWFLLLPLLLVFFAPLPRTGPRKRLGQCRVLPSWLAPGARMEHGEQVHERARARCTGLHFEAAGASMHSLFFCFLIFLIFLLHRFFFFLLFSFLVFFLLCFFISCFFFSFSCFLLMCSSLWPSARAATLCSRERLTAICSASTSSHAPFAANWAAQQVCGRVLVLMSRPHRCDAPCGTIPLVTRSPKLPVCFLHFSILHCC